MIEFKEFSCWRGDDNNYESVRRRILRNRKKALDFMNNKLIKVISIQEKEYLGPPQMNGDDRGSSIKIWYENAILTKEKS